LEICRAKIGVQHKFWRRLRAEKTLISLYIGEIR
jgi:hypothetical protein